MSKRAEEAAIDAWAIYEYREHPKGLYHTCFVDGYKEGYEQAEKDLSDKAKYSSGWDGFYYGKGYEQAEKDHALTWIDIRNILSIAREVEDENDDCPLLKSELCDEILKRFNEQRKK